MDKQILNQLEAIQKSLATMALTMVTKEDAKKFATKDDLKAALVNHPTKADLKEALANHPTHNDLEENYPSKADLKEALATQSEDICKVMTELFIQTDTLKASKKDLIALDKRVTRLEQN